MGITVSASSQPSIQSLNPDGTVGGAEVQQTGGLLAGVYSFMVEVQVTVGTTAIGFALGGIPGAVVGAYFGSTAMDALYGTSVRENMINDGINDRNLRDLGDDLKGSSGTDNLGKPLNYTGNDANLMTRDQAGQNITYPSTPTNLKPWIVKLIRNQSMTQRDLDMFGLFMLTIKSARVTEWIQGIARSRVACTVITISQNDFPAQYSAKKAELYKAACDQIGPAARTQRDRVRNKLALGRAYSKASKLPIDYSRTTVYYSVGGKNRTERYVAKMAIENLAQQDAWGTTQKKVIGRWARAKLTTSALTSAWCNDMAKGISSRKTFISGQISAAKAQF